MISLDQISKKIQDLENGQISQDEFEDWFSVESWNIHKQGSSLLTEAVFALESVFSRYYDDKLRRDRLAAELGNSLRPFEPVSNVAVDFDYPSKGQLSFHVPVRAHNLRKPLEGLREIPLESQGVTLEIVSASGPRRRADPSTFPIAGLPLVERPLSVHV